MTGLPLSNPATWRAPWPKVLDAMWPDWRKFTAVPPLDDRDLAAAVKRGDLPRGVMDRMMTVDRFGGIAHPNTDYLPVGPVIIKPRRSVTGLGIEVATDVAPCLVPRGCFAQPLYSGAHLSTDWAVVRGVPLWGIQTEGVPAGFGRFVAWHGCRVVSDPAPRFASGFNGLMRKFSGVVNVETIGGEISEVHFRPSLELFRLYGTRAVRALMRVAQGHPSQRPPVRGGSLIVVPRGAVDVVPEAWGEESWRGNLCYVEAPA